MAATYDPRHPQYFDEADVRGELTRVYDVCHRCRRCLEFCTAFPTLFQMIDQLADRDAGGLTPAQQDQVVDRCFHCTRCSIDCPFVPERHEWAVDVPRLMLRADAMRSATGQLPLRQRIATRMLGRADRLSKAATLVVPLANKTLAAPAGSAMRKAVTAVTGLSPVRLVAPFARQRFSRWFAERAGGVSGAPRGAVTVFPTCIVEHHAPQIGKDLVRVYERNGIECALTDAGCCGAPWLHSGDLERFAKVAAKNVAILADEVRRGGDIVVPQPTCGLVLTQDYVDHVGGPDAELVAAHTHDPSQYLLRIHEADGAALDTGFTGAVPRRVAYHVACHLRAQNIGLPGRDLIVLTGAEVDVVEQCSGIGGVWGLGRRNDEWSTPMTERLGARVDSAGADAVAGDCNLANTGIAERTGAVPLHPIQVIARAYGLPDD